RSQRTSDGCQVFVVDAQGARRLVDEPDDLPVVVARSAVVARVTRSPDVGTLGHDDACAFRLISAAVDVFPADLWSLQALWPLGRGRVARHAVEVVLVPFATRLDGRSPARHRATQ